MNIDSVLEKWSKAKEEKSYYEKQCDIYKQAIETYMDKKKTNLIETNDFILTKRYNTRIHLSKNNIPKEIYYKYSTRITYNTYNLKKIK